MASTRQKNSLGDYALEKAKYEKQKTHALYPYRRISYKTTLPDAGINVGQVPNSQLSGNAIDVESRLYGIGASNVIEPQESLRPDIYLLPNTSFFERQTTFMPEPLVVEKNQRPFPSS
tara:strand:- start:2519 stop:2872 length:354 start_codon:yes stop_codon:yes gene_type:complete